LAESQEIVALFLKKQAGKENEPITQKSVSQVTSSFGTNPPCIATLSQPQYNPQFTNTNAVAMTNNKAFYLHHALQDKSRQCEKEFYISTERIRQSEKDSEERHMLSRRESANWLSRLIYPY